MFTWVSLYLGLPCFPSCITVWIIFEGTVSGSLSSFVSHFLISEGSLDLDCSFGIDRDAKDCESYLEGVACCLIDSTLDTTRV